MLYQLSYITAQKSGKAKELASGLQPQSHCWLQNMLYNQPRLAYNTAEVLAKLCYMAT